MEDSNNSFFSDKCKTGERTQTYFLFLHSAVHVFAASRWVKPLASQRWSSASLLRPWGRPSRIWSPVALWHGEAGRTCSSPALLAVTYLTSLWGKILWTDVVQIKRKCCSTRQWCVFCVFPFRCIFPHERLPLPWLLYSVIHSLTATPVSSSGLVCASVLLFLVLFFFITSVASCRWRISWMLGSGMVFFYLVFVAVSLMMQFDIIVCPIS